MMPLRVPWKAVTPLWFVGYYDGPLSGVCLYGGSPHWYEVVDNNERWRRYVLKPLTSEQFDALRFAQEKFATYVGTHTYLTPSWGRAGIVVIQDDWHHYYELPNAERHPVDVASLPVVAWFSRSPHRCRSRSNRYWAIREVAA